MKTLNGQDLKEMLEELYRFHNKEAKRLNNKICTTDELYMLGVNNGAQNAIGTVYLALYGGDETIKMLGSCLDGPEGEMNDP